MYKMVHGDYQIALLLTNPIICHGAVFRPKDRKVVEYAVKDFSPGIKDNVIKLLNSWEGKNLLTT
jgi:hypothetical protein